MNDELPECAAGNRENHRGRHQPGRQGRPEQGRGRQDQGRADQARLHPGSRAMDQADRGAVPNHPDRGPGLTPPTQLATYSNARHHRNRRQQLPRRPVPRPLVPGPHKSPRSPRKALVPHGNRSWRLHSRQDG